MTISDHDRKLLWGRAGNRCAICKLELVASRTAQDRESVVGDEAHIVAQSPGGPRFRPLAPNEVDVYDNLVLLCRVDHKMVDDQPGEYTEQRLRQIKAAHESFVSARLAPDAGVARMRMQYDPRQGPVWLTRLKSGGDVWAVIDGAAQALLPPLDEEQGYSAEQCDLADAFLDKVNDYIDISDTIADYEGHARVRVAKRDISADLLELAAGGLAVYGGRRQVVVTGGAGESTAWWEAVLLVRHLDPAQPTERLLLAGDRVTADQSQDRPVPRPHLETQPQAGSW